MKIQPKTVLRVLTVFALTGSLVAAIFWSFNQVGDSAMMRKSARVTIVRAHELLIALVDAETSQRGYCLSGDETLLAPHTAIRETADDLLTELYGMVPDSRSRRHLLALRPMVADQITGSQLIIDHFRKYGSIRNLPETTGKHLMNTIRNEMKDFIALQDGKLAEHGTDFQNDMRSMLWVIFATSLLLLLFMLYFTRRSYQSAKNKLKDLSLLKDRQLLEIEETTNKRLYQANLSLQISEEKLAVTLNSIGDGVLATDTAGYVTLLNPVAEKLTGWNLADALGRPAEEIFHIIDEKTRQPSNLPIKETIAHGTAGALVNHTLLVSRTGRECAIADSCAPIHTRSGGVIGAVLIFRDITARRAIETGLSRSHEELITLTTELERVARAKTEFLSNMSHELRTPLNSINGFSEVLSDETFGPLNDKQKTYVNNVLASGKHLLLLINQILDMAKVESGKMKLSLSHLSTGGLLHEMALLITDLAGKKDIHIELEIAEDLPDLEADELKFKEILYNLLSNAVKFSPHGSRIGLRAVKLDEYVEIAVWDTGIGIAPENLEKVFEGFFRVDTPYAWVTEGTGLGLPLSRKFVELHGGTLVVESDGLQTGTTVRFTLPIVSRIATQEESTGRQP